MTTRAVQSVDLRRIGAAAMGIGGSSPPHWTPSPLPFPYPPFPLSFYPFSLPSIPHSLAPQWPAKLPASSPLPPLFFPVSLHEVQLGDLRSATSPPKRIGSKSRDKLEYGNYRMQKKL